MKRAGFPLMIFLLISGHLLAGQPVLTAQEYINTWKDEAIYQMAEHKIPASITLAQGMLESGNGNSRLAVKGNNHFGIKCHNDWQGEKIYEDDETSNECFRKYQDARESYEDHSKFLLRDRYKKLFDLGTTDYKAWAKGLKECGYATNPKYPDLLIRIIEEHDLEQYDKIGMSYLAKGNLPSRNGVREKPIENNNTTEHPVSKSKRRGNPENETREIHLGQSRQVFTTSNDVQFVEAKAGELPKDIAEEFDMGTWQILNYNNVNAEYKFKEKQVVYLQPKRAKGTQDTYTVVKGDNTWSISQQFAIRIKKLRKINGIPDGREPTVGTVIKLK